MSMLQLSTTGERNWECKHEIMQNKKLITSLICNENEKDEKDEQDNRSS